MTETIIQIRKTGAGAKTWPVAIDPTVKVELEWKTRTRGEARVSGFGRYLLINVTNFGNHWCVLFMRHEDGREEVLERNSPPSRFCRLCTRFRGEE